MESLTRIFIAEQDCESLVSTMLWLEQFADFEVYGAVADNSVIDQINQLQPDMVMLSVPSATAQAAMAIKTIRATTSTPAVMLVTKTDTNVEVLMAECDGQIGPKTNLREIPDLLRKAINRHRVSSLAATSLPMAKAG